MYKWVDSKLWALMSSHSYSREEIRSQEPWSRYEAMSPVSTYIYVFHTLKTENSTFLIYVHRRQCTIMEVRKRSGHARLTIVCEGCHSGPGMYGRTMGKFHQSTAYTTHGLVHNALNPNIVMLINGQTAFHPRYTLLPTTHPGL